MIKPLSPEEYSREKHMNPGQNRRYLTIVGLLITAILVVALFPSLGCSDSKVVSISTPGTINVSFNSLPVALITSAEIEDLPVLTATTKTGTQSGPALLVVFNSIGINKFGKVTAVGLSKDQKSIRQVLEVSEVTESVLLSKNGDGSFGLYNPVLPLTNQIFVVTDLMVDPAECCTP
jgi:hypothetical protein